MKNSNVELAAMLLVGCFCVKDRELSNEIDFEVHFAPNLLSAIYTAGELGYGRNPLLKYVDITAADRLLLQRSGNLIGFVDGDMGELIFPTYFLPCYLEVASAAQYNLYVVALKEAMQANRFDSFLKRYPVDFTDIFINGNRHFFFQCEADWKLHTEPLLPAYFKVLDVFTRYAAQYESSIWPADRQYLQQQACSFAGYIQQYHIVGGWEQLLGYPILGNHHIYLCRYNNIWADAASVCFYQNQLDGSGYQNMVVDIVSHEVGAHLLYREAWLGEELQQVREQHPEVLYAAYESLVMFYNQKVLDRRLTYDLDYYHGKEFLNIYDLLSNLQLSVVDMLRNAVEQMAPLWNLS
ncbi:hypothetical protein [Alistipes sp. ZOR0009]|uniref:hypothetical protein n=1 Tax=Alistipes sp. ZOR0009 TaxID=1339253 RepID=UPI00064652CC|nr:hypothetical protein [Alistipes sp. ZOR0009]